MRLAIPLILLAVTAFSCEKAAPPAAPATAPTTSVAAAQAKPISYEHEIVPLLQKYCYDCHGDGEHAGEVALDDFKDIPAIKSGQKTWETVLHHVHTSEMPPEDADPKPTLAERELITQWIEKTLYDFDPAHPDPGRVTIHRLNRAEYNNTIRDLVGVDFQAAADFPPDDSGYGFDNIGDVLSLPPVLMEKYLAAADKILNEAIPTEPIKSSVRRIPAAIAEVGFNAIGDRGDGWVQLISLEDDDVGVTLPVSAGDYLVRVQAFCKPTGGISVGGGNNNRVASTEPTEPNKISILANNAFVQNFELSTDEANPGVYEARVGMPAGRERFRAAMLRIRGGANEDTMVNGRVGKQQPGIGLVKYIEIEGPLPGAVRRYPAANLEATGDGQNLAGGTRRLDHNGDVTVTIDVPSDGEFILRAQAYAEQAGDEPTMMDFRIDGESIKTFDVVAPATHKATAGQRLFSPTLLLPLPAVYEMRTKLSAGKHKFSTAFINDLEDAENKNPNLRDRTLFIDHLEVVDLSQPASQPEMPPRIRELFSSIPSRPDQPNAARTIIAKFGRRAWRRPVANDQLDRLMSLYKLADQNGESFEGSVKLAMKAILVSPNFLFRGEVQPEPNNPKAIRPIDEYSLASRLSYYLWSSAPDDELLNLAEHGQLRKNLAAQVKRMLAAPAARAMVENFANQWLQTRSLETMAPDKDLFPNFDPGLRAAMQKETEMFFEYVMRQDRSMMDFLTGDYTFVNERLAKHYGIADVTGEEFRRVSLEGTPRRGVLTHASVLTLTSNPTRTSPVKRGKWVLENLLGTPPPPPPPNVPPLEKEGQKLTGSLRQQMVQHRQDPTCASCHARMDPIGFGLENFDAVGAWRAKEGETDIDSSGELVSGESFSGASELADILATKKRPDFVRCMSEKMLTYALGRGLEYYDRPATDQIGAALEQGEYKFSSLIMAVVNSQPFQMCRGEKPPEQSPAQTAKR